MENQIEQTKDTTNLSEKINKTINTEHRIERDSNEKQKETNTKKTTDALKKELKSLIQMQNKIKTKIDNLIKSIKSEEENLENIKQDITKVQNYILANEILTISTEEEIINMESAINKMEDSNIYITDILQLLYEGNFDKLKKIQKDLKS